MKKIISLFLVLLSFCLVSCYTIREVESIAEIDDGRTYYVAGMAVPNELKGKSCAVINADVNMYYTRTMQIAGHASSDLFCYIYNDTFSRIITQDAGGEHQLIGGFKINYIITAQ